MGVFMKLFGRGKMNEDLKIAKLRGRGIIFYLSIVLSSMLGEKSFDYIRRKYFHYRIKKKKFKEREIYFLKNIIFKGDCCIDIGAAQGEYTYILSKTVGSKGKVYSFEPVGRAFEKLEELITHYDLKNVSLFNYALGDKNGSAIMLIPLLNNVLHEDVAHLDNDMGSATHCIEEKVMVKTLDNFVLEHNIEKIDFIKCDVEGAELQVLEGGKNTILDFMPIVLCEVEARNLKRFKKEMKDVFLFFSNLNYDSFYLSEDILIKYEKYNLNDNFRIKEGKYINNFFFVPNSKLSLIEDCI